MRGKIFSGLLAAAGLCCFLTGCSDNDANGLDGQEKMQVTMNPAQDADFKVYSGGVTIGSTFAQATKGANVNGNLWYQTFERPTNVTDEERAKAIEEFSKKREGAKNTLQVNWTNFWVQQVYKGETQYTDGYGQSTGAGSNKMNHLLVFNNLKEEVISWWPYQVKYSFWEGDYEHINNFNSGNNTTSYTDDQTHEQFIGTTLMVNMHSDGRDEQFGYHNSQDSKNHFEYIILKIDGAYYVGFDFYATHPDGQEANKNMDVERDWVFNDWIVKISPAQLLGAAPVNPNLEGDAAPAQPEDPATPASPAALGIGEVEVNLSLNAEKEKDDYIATKLSIHVRDTTDVEVFIPVPANYYCEADDMYIVSSHAGSVEMHGADPAEMTYNVNGQEIKLTVSYEMDGIRVKTSGINAAALKFLREVFADGLTFEVWNYYPETVTRDTLKPMLDASRVSFAEDPDRYINAFGKVGGVKNPLDCSVKPDASWGSGETAESGSASNTVYTK